MELAHNFTVSAPVEQAWEVLLDLEKIAPCMPGATLTSYEGEEFTGNVRVKLGPVTMTFAGQGRFVERDAEARRIVVEASGKDRRGGGSARATIKAALRPEGDATAVEVHSDLVVTGRVAQFGRGMIADVSTRLLGQFTDCLSGKLAESGAVAPAAEAPPGPEPAGGAPAAGAPAGGAPAAGAPAAGAPATADPAGSPAAAPVPAMPAGVPPAVPEPAAAPLRPPVEAEPIDLLGVTGIRSGAVRLLPYLLVFLLGGVVGGVLVALLVG